MAGPFFQILTRLYATKPINRINIEPKDKFDHKTTQREGRATTRGPKQSPPSPHHDAFYSLHAPLALPSNRAVLIGVLGDTTKPALAVKRDRSVTKESRMFPDFGKPRRSIDQVGGGIWGFF